MLSMCGGSEMLSRGFADKTAVVGEVARSEIDRMVRSEKEEKVRGGAINAGSDVEGWNVLQYGQYRILIHCSDDR